MIKSVPGARKASLAALAITTLVAGLGPTGAAVAQPGFQFDRIAGDNRYETAADVADRFAVGGGVDHVILASGERGRWPDALSANFLAGARNAPILLTTHDTTPTATKQQLNQLGKDTKVWVVGGSSAISNAQVRRLRNDGFTVQRVAGADRWATNTKVIGQGGRSREGLGVVASGLKFPDALAGGPLVYAENMPLGLTKSDDIPDSVVQALQAAGVTRVLVVGGTAVVSDKVVAELRRKGITLEKRLAGPDRAATSVAVAEYALGTLGFAEAAVNAASGYEKGEGADALAGGPLSGEQQRPVLITTNGTKAGQAVLDHLDDGCESLTQGTVFGGTGALSTAVEEDMEAAASCENQDNATVTADKQARQGGTLTVNVTGDDIDSVKVSGPCVVERTYSPADDVDSAKAGYQFRVQVDGSAPEGSCAVTVVTSFTDASGKADETDTVTVQITDQAVTDAPELVAVEYVRTTSSGTTMRYTFDEEVVTSVEAAGFQLVGFDSEDRVETGNTAVRESGNTDAVLVVFDTVNAADFSRYSLGTVDFSAVDDADGKGNPEGARSINTGRAGTPGRTSAPDLLGVSNVRAGGTIADPTVLADFVFDENAHVIDPAAFELVLTSGTTLACDALPNGTSSDPTDFQGDGTTTTPVECADTTDPAVGATTVARGVALEDAVSDADQSAVFVPGVTPVAAAGGNRNPQQASDAPDGSSAGPDLVSVAVGATEQAGSSSPQTLCVTYTFDEAVSNTTGERVPAQFFLYNSDGDQSAGDVLCGSETAEGAAGDSDVTVGFELADSGDEALVDIDDIAGAGILDGAAQNTAGDARNDEVGHATAAIATGRTTGPDLVTVRRATTATNTDPITGAVTATQVTVSYTFDEELASLDDADSFYVYDARGNRFELNTCYAGNDASNDTGDAFGDDEVFCRVNAGTGGDVTGPGGADFDTPEERFAAVRAAVLGTVDDASVTDVAANPNPEGAAVIED
ncbi:MAG TPA: cell wall-binding repeat-containing protein [Nocardioidaceae bacterium]|nr:cell wall-binding repeat-containing protein [Nocardioidaceae bacterium]